MKLRFTMISVREYEPKPEYYPEDKRTPEGMLDIDLASAEDDPGLFFDGCSGTTYKIEAEIVPLDPPSEFCDE